MPELTDYAIWWLSQEDQETLGDIPRHDDPDQAQELAAYRGPDLPNYIRLEYRSREGRAGRGRLWVSDQLGLPREFEIPWAENTLTKLLEGYQDDFRHWHGSYGGIVIWARDVPLVACLPGLVTDLDLNFWRI
jgi:hypothetical protein